MIARSYLFVPGDRPERFDKALATEAHRVVIDLEDAVAIDAKAQARTQIAQWLQSPLSDEVRERVVIRVNAYGTPWHEEDVSMVRAANVRAVMAPKAEDAAQLADIAARCVEGVELIALVESVADVVRMRAIAQSGRVARLAFGSFDFGVDAGIDGTGRELDYVRSQFVIESRFAGLPPPVDGVTLAVQVPISWMNDVVQTWNQISGATAMNEALLDPEARDPAMMFILIEERRGIAADKIAQIDQRPAVGPLLVQHSSFVWAQRPSNARRGIGAFGARFDAC